MSTLKRRGFCHVFGDDVPLDEGVMAFRFAIQRVTDPKELIPHLFEAIDPEFVRRVKPGDFVIAGRNFGCGKTHVQGFIAMTALGMSVLCESIPYKPLRRAVGEGLPVLAGCRGATGFARTGDEIEVDFNTGAARNLTQGTEAAFPAMPPILRDLAMNGGMRAQLSDWLRNHPEQGVAQAPAASQT